MSVPQNKNLKKILSKIGFALFFSPVITFIILVAIVLVTVKFNIIELNTINKVVLLNVLATFFVTYPVIYIILKHIPRQSYNDNTCIFSKKNLLNFFLMGMFIMYIGNKLGGFLANIISGGLAINPVLNLVSKDSLILPVLVTGIGAPVFEELIYRKLFMDIIAPYDKKMAIIFTALCFSLVHGNIFQLFYTFGLGLLLGYVYIKSGQIIDTILLHCSYNIVGGVIPMIILSTDSANLADAIWSKCVLVIVIIGAILFLKNYKIFTLGEFKDNSLQKTNYSVFLNFGTIIFAVIQTVGIVTSIIMQKHSINLFT